MGGAGRLLDRRRLLEKGVYQIIYGNCLPHRFVSPWLQFKIHSVRFSCFNSTVAYSTDCIACIVLYFPFFNNVLFLFFTEPLCVITEFAPYGDLLGFLRKKRGLSDGYYNIEYLPQRNLTSKRLMQFASEIADGMAFLSSEKVCIFCILWFYGNRPHRVNKIKTFGISLKRFTYSYEAVTLMCDIKAQTSKIPFRLQKILRQTMNPSRTTRSMLVTYGVNFSFFVNFTIFR